MNLKLKMGVKKFIVINLTFDWRLYLGERKIVIFTFAKSRSTGNLRIELDFVNLSDSQLVRLSTAFFL